jgi:alkanesulfonate monooxygenase SsuD/methylene tetrahydromethanopterin reductase-like flavin-dependent oxidoreductase (luciferase family)
VAGSFQRPDPLFDWFIPIDGDGAHIGTLRAERPPTFDYLRRVVETAEELGFNSLLIPTRFTNGIFDEGAPLAETWTTVTALGAVTDRIRFLVAVRPGFISTGLFAQMAATLDEITGGRLDINVVPGGIQGEYVNLNGAVCSPGPGGDGPRFYLGGASDRALALAGRQSDVYLMWIGTSSSCRATPTSRSADGSRLTFCPWSDH